MVFPVRRVGIISSLGSVEFAVALNRDFPSHVAFSYAFYARLDTPSRVLIGGHVSSSS